MFKQFVIVLTCENFSSWASPEAAGKGSTKSSHILGEVPEACGAIEQLSGAFLSRLNQLPGFRAIVFAFQNAPLECAKRASPQSNAKI